SCCRRAGMDPASLTAFLAPFMPYLIKGVGELAEEAVSGLGHEAWKYAKAIWARLSPSVESKEGAREAAEFVADDPDDGRARAALELQLEKLLEADPDLAAAVEERWREAEAANVISVGDRGALVMGNMEHSVIVTGDDSTVRNAGAQ